MKCFSGLYIRNSLKVVRILIRFVCFMIVICMVLLIYICILGGFYVFHVFSAIYFL